MCVNKIQRKVKVFESKASVNEFSPVDLSIMKVFVIAVATGEYIYCKGEK